MKKDVLGYVVLKKIHEEQKSLLDAYMPFIEYALFHDGKTYFELSELRDIILDICGLEIPLNTIKTLLKKLRKDNLIEPIEGYNYIQIINSKDVENYKQLFDKSDREKNKFFHEMIKYLQIEILEEVIEEKFIEFIYDSIEMVNPIPYFDPDTNEITNKEYLLFFRFIEYIKTYNDELYEIFKNIFYGALLSRVTDFDKIDNNKSMDNITVILDTDILFRVIGLQNPVLCEATEELLKLIKSRNMVCRCLMSSVNEMRNVLLHRLKWLKEGKIPKQVNEQESLYMDGIVGAIYRKSMSIDDLEELIKKLEIELTKYDIKVDYHDCLEDVRDEKLLEEYFDKKLYKFMRNKKIDEYDSDVEIEKVIDKDAIPEYIQKTVLKKSRIDIQMIEYVRNLRKRKIYNFNEVGTIILSGDRQIARYSLHLDDSLILPEVFLEENFTNNLWLCDPVKNDNISIDLILSMYNASSYIDYKLMFGFHEYLQKYKESQPGKFELLGDVFKNTNTITRLKEAEDADDQETKNKVYEDIIRLAVEANERNQNELYERIQNMSGEIQLARKGLQEKEKLKNGLEKKVEKVETEKNEIKNELEKEVKEVKEKNDKVLSDNSLLKSEIKRSKRIFYFLIPALITIIFSIIFKFQCIDIFDYIIKVDKINIIIFITKSLLELFLIIQIVLIVQFFIKIKDEIDDKTIVIKLYFNNFFKNTGIVIIIYLIPLLIAFISSKF